MRAVGFDRSILAVQLVQGNGCGLRPTAAPTHGLTAAPLTRRVAPGGRSGLTSARPARSLRERPTAAAAPRPRRRSLASRPSAPMSRITSRTVLRSAVALLVAGGALGPPFPGHAAAQEHGGHGGHGEPLTAAEPGRIEVRHEAEAGDLITLLGPFVLPTTGNTMRLTAAEVVVVPVDGWLTSFRTRILDTEGRPLTNRVLHHINVVRPGQRELFFPIMQRIAAAGQETGEIRTPFPFGVPVSAGDTLLIAAMIHNPTGAPIEVVVESRFHYETTAWLDRIPVQPFHLDIEPPPVGAAFDLPPGRSERTWEGSPAVDVHVLAVGGHIHRLGQELRLEEVRPDGSARVLWRTAPELDADGQVARVPRKTFLLRGGIVLSADRMYRLVAVYDNPTGAVIPDGGMAEIAGVARAKRGWPAADRSDPWFHADYANFTRHNPTLEPGTAPAGDPHHH